MSSEAPKPLMFQPAVTEVAFTFRVWVQVCIHCPCSPCPSSVASSKCCDRTYIKEFRFCLCRPRSIIYLIQCLDHFTNVGGDTKISRGISQLCRRDASSVFSAASIHVFYQSVELRAQQFLLSRNAS